MVKNSEFLKELSPPVRLSVGLFCTLFPPITVLVSNFSGNTVSLILSLVVGIPLFLMGVSLLFGKGRKGDGIFSPGTLYFISFVLLASGVLALFYGVFQGLTGIFISIYLFVLAKQRKERIKLNET